MKHELTKPYHLLSRRAFMGMSLVALASPGLPNSVHDNSAEQKGSPGTSPFTILFQGDSITDGNRGRNDDPNHIMGHGYAFSVASRLGADYPERNLKFINKGISGNRVSDLAARWDKDTLDLHPDALSILVGVNDAYFRIKDNVTTPDNFDENYRALLDRTKAAYPNILLILCEPFVLPVGMVKDNLDRWMGEIVPRQKVVSELAREYNAVHVSFQDVFTKACKRAAADYWIWDGIHPTVAGHELMTRAWINAVSKSLPMITPRYITKKR